MLHRLIDGMVAAASLATELVKTSEECLQRFSNDTRVAIDSKG